MHMSLIFHYTSVGHIIIFPTDLFTSERAVGYIVCIDLLVSSVDGCIRAVLTDIKACMGLFPWAGVLLWL